MQTISSYLGGNPYPGRGIFLGLTPDGQHAALAYFIMGRSENSRNRVFLHESLEVRTQAQDPAKLSDPSLIIYNVLRQYANHTIVTNGDQTDTIFEAFCRGEGFEQALRSREYEPDSPNFTPRISGLISIIEGRAQYKLSILKKGGEGCQRFFYEYAQPEPGLGHIIHTYSGDGSPLPSFCGEPVALPTQNDIEAFSQELWQALNKENRVALHVRYLRLGKQDPLFGAATQIRYQDRFGGAIAGSSGIVIGGADKTEVEK